MCKQCHVPSLEDFCSEDCKQQFIKREARKWDKFDTDKVTDVKRKALKRHKRFRRKRKQPRLTKPGASH